jgi:ribonucleoside-diphosphate reductase alpha chain
MSSQKFYTIMTNTIHVKKRNGRLEVLDVNKINKVVARACEGLENVSASEVALDAKLQFYDKIQTIEIDKALMLTARSKIEKDPDYSYLASRLIQNSLYKEVFGEGVDADTFELLYRKAFIKNIKALVKEGRLDSRLLSFNLKKLADALDLDRDNLFKYHGMQIVYDRYLIQLNSRRMETPQAFWMRVAMGLALNEPNKEEKALEFYNTLSQFNGCTSTPTLFNSGTTHSQLSSCYLNTFDDSVDGIFEGLWQEARKSKYAGGLGFDVTPFRATGAFINGTNGASSGLIPWLKIYNDMLIAVNQGGRRPGSGCAYLEPWHLDVEDFIELRQPTGEDRRRTHDMNTALWMPDLFFKKVEAEEDWYLFCPSEAGHLHDLFGPEFDKAYLELCKKADDGEIKHYRKIKAKDLWKKILRSVYETSHPWITFKDPSNLRYSNIHEGIVHSSNLCTEIMLHTKASKYTNGIKTEIGETAVCNLSSVNLPKHIKYTEKAPEIDWTKLKTTVKTMVRMLDNVIDINFYPTEESKNSNLKHRPVGLGTMGYQDVCHILGIVIDSSESIKLAGRIQEFISYYAIETSNELAIERGAYSTFNGSTWSKGKLPIDTYHDSQQIRFALGQAEPAELYDGSPLDWDTLRASIIKTGMRNSNLMAIAPTATISYIQGCEQSIEPTASVLFVYENKSGNLPIINEHFVRDMKKIGVWSSQFAEAVKAVDGDVMQLNIPDEYKAKYKLALDRDMFTLIEVAAERQKWIDMGQSFNVYNQSTSLKHMHDIVFKAWKKGLKTTYYWRNKAASKVEKSTGIVVNMVEESQEKVKACSIEAMRRGEVCESCQ